MSILLHPLWPELRPYFKVEECAPGDGGVEPRFRIEVGQLQGAIYVQALNIQVGCCSCGRLIHPIRERKAKGNKRSEHVGKHLYYACACPLSESVGCSRGSASSQEYQRIKHAVLDAARAEQWELAL